MQALDGITVLDLARGYPPAHISMFLGDFGARVIRVDSPEGNKIEKLAGIDPLDERYAVLNRLNRNKESIIINLKSEEGLNVFYRLVKKADVIIEGFRPGVMKRLRSLAAIWRSAPTSPTKAANPPACSRQKASPKLSR